MSTYMLLISPYQFKPVGHEFESVGSYLVGIFSGATTRYLWSPVKLPGKFQLGTIFSLRIH